MKPPVSSKQRHRAFRKGGYATQGDLKPGIGKPKPAKRKHLRDYINWLWPYRWPLLVLFALSFITALLDSVWPLAIKRVIDVLPQEMEQTLKSHKLNLFGLAVVSFLLAKQVVETL